MLNVLFVCKRTYLEAAHLIFTQNSFHLHDVWSTLDLAITLPQGRAKQVRSISLQYDYGSQRTLFDSSVANIVWRHTWTRLSSDFLGLRCIEIQIKVRFLQQILKFTRFNSMIDVLTTLPLESVKFRTAVHYPNDGGSDEQVAGGAVVVQEFERKIEMKCLKRSDELQGDSDTRNCHCHVNGSDLPSTRPVHG